MVQRTRQGLSNLQSNEMNTHIYPDAEVINSLPDGTLYYEYTYMDHQDSFGVIRVSRLPQPKQLHIRSPRRESTFEELDDQYSYRNSSAVPHSILGTGQDQRELASSTVAEDELAGLLEDLGVDESFLGRLEINLRIDRLRRNPFLEIAERLSFLLDISCDSEDNDMMSVCSFQGAVEVIESISLLPVAIGMDYTGELEVVWKKRELGITVIVDFLDDGNAWYYVSMDGDEIQSDTVLAVDVSQVISVHLAD